MKLFPCLLLAVFARAAGADAPLAASKPPFLSLETPLQMAGQAGGGLVGALAVGWIGANIGSSHARHRCLERIDPDFSDECGWAGFGGAVIGFLIGVPLGHALGALSVGALQGKHGAPVAAVSALAGDVALFFLARGLHDGLDGKLLSNGSLDPILIPVALAGMVAIPIATQSIWDYRVRIALQPGVAPGSSAAGTRFLLRFAEVGF
jgi:hypothetical protein